MIVVAIIALLAASAFPLYNNAVAKAHKRALAADMNELYRALMRYSFDNNKFPADSGAGALNTTTLEPLVAAGYFPVATGFNRKLSQGHIQFYFAPDWRGQDADFLVVARSRIDPNMVFYAMHYSIFGFFTYDGVYVLKDGVFSRADEAI
jgi:type II secretory pathway pseudopilin PulG